MSAGPPQGEQSPKVMHLQGHPDSSVRKIKFGYRCRKAGIEEERLNGSRLYAYGTEKDRNKCSKRKGQGTRKQIMRQANDVILITPSVTLQMTPSWVGVSICLKVGRLCREIWTGWMDGSRPAV